MVLVAATGFQVVAPRHINPTHRNINPTPTIINPTHRIINPTFQLQTAKEQDGGSVWCGVEGGEGWGAESLMPHRIVMRIVAITGT